MLAKLLHEAITKVCPIDGVSVGKEDDKSTWRIDFKSVATAQERTAAQTTLNNFDLTLPEKAKTIEALRQAALYAEQEKILLAGTTPEAVTYKAELSK